MVVDEAQTLRSGLPHLSSWPQRARADQGTAVSFTPVASLQVRSDDRLPFPDQVVIVHAARLHGAATQCSAQTTSPVLRPSPLKISGGSDMLPPAFCS
jgi:hypothetical protein